MERVGILAGPYESFVNKCWGYGSCIEAISCAKGMLPVNRPDDPTVRALTSISKVTYDGVGTMSGAKRGEAVAASARVSDVPHKHEGENTAPKINPTGMHTMCSNTVAKAVTISG
jgi:hypothetical protein